MYSPKVNLLQQILVDIINLCICTTAFSVNKDQTSHPRSTPRNLIFFQSPTMGDGSLALTKKAALDYTSPFYAQNPPKDPALSWSNPGHANDAQSGVHVLASSSSTVKAADKASLPLTDSQWSTLFSLLQNTHNGTTSNENLSGKYRFTWMLDTGASFHMTGDRKLLHNISSIDSSSITLLDGLITTANTSGSVNLGSNLCLNNVLLVPNLACNLIYLVQLIKDHNYIVKLTNKLCICISMTLIGVGEERKGVYWFGSEVPHSCSSHTSQVNYFQLLHWPFGHPAASSIHLIPGVSLKNSKHNKIEPCEVCSLAKQTRSRFPSSSSHSSVLFSLVHCDVWGPYRTPSSPGASYFLTLVDACSRCVWVYLMKNKTEVSSIIPNFIAMASTQFNKTIARFRSDNGTKFTCLRPYSLSKGIGFETSCVRTPQQNGKVERKHRHILNVTCAIRFQAHLPLKFWGECILAATYLINQTPTQILQNKKPYEILHGKPPLLTHICTFGCLCFASKWSG